jgi:hypothetical protein
MRIQIRNFRIRNIGKRFMLSFLFFFRADNSSQKSHSSGGGGGGGYPMPQLTDPGGGYYQQQQQHGPNSNGHHSDGASPGSSQLSVDGGRGESTLITRTQKQHVTQNVSL